MTRDEAIQFLKVNQPLPSDDNISQEQISTFDAIREYVIENPDPSFIPLMLNAFGNGDGYGVYQICDDVFRCFTADEVVPYLEKALASPHWGVRYWGTQWALDFPDERLIPVLTELTKDSHEGCLYFAVCALGEIVKKTGNAKALQAVRERRSGETDKELLEMIDDIIDESSR